MKQKAKNILDYPIHSLKNLRPAVIQALNKKNIYTVQNLIDYFPKRYEDRSTLLDIQNALQLSQKRPDFITTLIAQCIDKEKTFFRSRQINKFLFTDQTGNFSVPAFNPYTRFQIGQFYILSGKTRKRGREIQIFINEYETFDEEAVKNLNSGRIVPIYSSGENLNQKLLRNLIHQLLLSIKDVEISYNVPPTLINKHRFPPKKTCYERVHFPDKKKDIEEHKKPLIYEEFYHIQKVLAEKKSKQIKGKEPNRYHPQPDFDIFMQQLPFKLTLDQEKTWQEIKHDLLSPKAMYRMLQGDVGTGKTLLALISMMFTYCNGYQSVLMAPTEILASQHYRTFSRLLDNYVRKTGMDIKLTLLTGGGSSKAQEIARWDITEEKQLLIIGTHSLIQKNIQFKNLKYVVIDEQHRFGVEQREALIAKGEFPDFCTMTATPIPRSLFVSFFGDLDVSLLMEKPNQSKSISEKTNEEKRFRHCRLLWEKERSHGYKFLIDRIKRGEQGYIVFPVIEESSKKNLRSLLKEYELLKEKVFKGIPTGLIHGKMNAEEKQHLMEEFRKENLKVLLATTVLEVGIDHHNATTIIIESAHQFGLSQLHQLRGRVGRGEKIGYCYLVVKEGMNPETIHRLQKFSYLENGFQIAELDLEMRGPGDLTGVKQSGIPPLKIGNLTRDYELLLKARQDVYTEFFPNEELSVYFTQAMDQTNKAHD